MALLFRCNAQTPEQIEIARKFGIDIEDLIKDLEQIKILELVSNMKILFDKKKETGKKTYLHILVLVRFEDRFGSEYILKPT